MLPYCAENFTGPSPALRREACEKGHQEFEEIWRGTTWSSSGEPKEETAHNYPPIRLDEGMLHIT
jgi:hypothetical protein